MSLDFADAVSWLFVPGDRPDRFAKAARSGADTVILDLEDAVAQSCKPDARTAVARYLTQGGSGWVRINNGNGPCTDDVVAVRDLPGLLGVVLPKAEEPADLPALSSELGLPLVALVETAKGVHHASLLAASTPDLRLAFGSVDFARDIGAAHVADALLLARSSLVLASRVAGRPPPIDGVTTSTSDPSMAQRDARTAKQLGFGGKLCVHPNQIAPVQAGFAPSAEELEWAGRVLAPDVAHDGATSIGGELVDAPVRALAERILGAKP